MQLSPLKWKFSLRKSVKFSDGTPFTAESFKYTISRIRKSARLRQYFKNIDKIEVIDDHTFIYHNREPDGGMWNRLTRWAGPISLKTKGMELAHISRNTYGTGPHVLKSWTKGQKMVFDANPNWWNNKNFPKRPQRVVLRRIRESATRAKALQAGEIDVAWGIMPQFIPQLEKNPKTKVAVVPAVRIMHMGFFTQHGGPDGQREGAQGDQLRHRRGSYPQDHPGRTRGPLRPDAPPLELLGLQPEEKMVRLRPGQGESPPQGSRPRQGLQDGNHRHERPLPGRQGHV